MVGKWWKEHQDKDQIIWGIANHRKESGFYPKYEEKALKDLEQEESHQYLTYILKDSLNLEGRE